MRLSKLILNGPDIAMADGSKLPPISYLFERVDQHQLSQPASAQSSPTLPIRHSADPSPQHPASYHSQPAQHQPSSYAAQTGPQYQQRSDSGSTLYQQQAASQFESPLYQQQQTYHQQSQPYLGQPYQQERPPPPLFMGQRQTSYASHEASRQQPHYEPHQSYHYSEQPQHHAQSYGGYQQQPVQPASAGGSVSYGNSKLVVPAYQQQQQPAHYPPHSQQNPATLEDFNMLFEQSNGVIEIKSSPEMVSAYPDVVSALPLPGLFWPQIRVDQYDALVSYAWQESDLSPSSKEGSLIMLNGHALISDWMAASEFLFLFSPFLRAFTSTNLTVDLNAEYLLTALLHPTNATFFRSILHHFLEPLVRFTSVPVDFLTTMSLLDGSNALLHVSKTVPLQHYTVIAALIRFLERHNTAFVQFETPYATSAAVSSKLQDDSLSDTVLGLAPHDKLHLIMFLISIWMDCPALLYHIDGLFGCIDIRKHLVKKDNNTSKQMQKELANLKRGRKVLQKQVLDLKSQKRLNMEDPAWDEDHSSPMAQSQSQTQQIDLEIQQTQIEINQQIQTETEIEDKIDRLEIQFLTSAVYPEIDSLLTSELFTKPEFPLRVRRLFARNGCLGLDRNGFGYWCFASFPDSLFVEVWSDDHLVEWMWYSGQEAISGVLDAFKYESEQVISEAYYQLRRSSSSSRAIDVSSSASSKSNVSDDSPRPLHIKAAPMPDFPGALIEKIQDMMRTVVRIAYSPAVNEPTTKNYSHFPELAFKSQFILANLNASLKFTAIRDWVLDAFDSIAKIDVELSEAHKPNPASKKKNAAASRKYSTCPPLLFCFADHQIEQVRPLDLKAVESSLANWRGCVDNCDRLEELWMFVAMLGTTVVDAVQDEDVEGGVYNAVSFKAFEDWVNKNSELYDGTRKNLDLVSASDTTLASKEREGPTRYSTADNSRNVSEFGSDMEDSDQDDQYGSSRLRKKRKGSAAATKKKSGRVTRSRKQ